jgi:hypothetical protein
MIPKLFHRVWLGGKPMPFYFQKWGESWMEKHPSWTMKLWKEEECEKLNNRDLFQKCTSLAQCADVARYEILYREGGVYLDTDMECLKNIETLINSVDFFACWQRPDLNILSNAIFGASPEHDLMQKITLDCRTDFQPEPWNAMGPPFFTKRLLGQPGVRIYDRKTFIPYTRDEYKAFPKHPMTITNPPAESFAINHRSSVWYKDSTSQLLAAKSEVKVVPQKQFTARVTPTTI